MYLPTTVKNPFSEIKFERKHLNREQIISKVWEVMLYLFCFFSYTMWISYHWFPKLYTASDTQPYALIFSTLFLLIYIWKEPMLKHETILILCFEFGVFCSYFASELLGARSILLDGFFAIPALLLLNNDRKIAK